ncbi:hypothetical protein [Rudanella lutea]|uniref:hypothetical protein n=1 Tax=Rudanella lutea TaxID=451374 RepID=UPI0003A329DA|nr:hypothetical protein [Rudanella lutea]
MFIVLVKTAVSVGLCLWLAVLLWKRLWITEYLQQHHRTPWIALFYTIFRLLPIVLTFFVMGYQPQSDVQYYYYPIANTARQFGIVYRDVYCPYSPFFGYWLSIPLHIWNDMRTIVVAMTLIEWLAVYVTFRIYRGVESNGQRLFRALFYFSLPVPFVMCVFSGQEDVALWLLALVAVWVWQEKKSPFWGGVLLALGLLSTKAVFVFLIIPLFLMAPNHQKAPLVAGLAALGLPVLAFLYWKTGLLFIEQPLDEGEYLKAPNWRSVLNPIIGGFIPENGGVWKWVMMLVTLVIISLTGIRAYGKRLVDTLPLIFLVAFGSMTVLQQNAVSNYAYLFVLPVVFTMTDFKSRLTTFLLVGFNALAAIHPSLWWRIGQPFYKGLSMFSRPEYALEYGIELALVAGFLYYAWLGYRAIDDVPLSAEGAVRNRSFRGRLFGLK